MMTLPPEISVEKRRHAHNGWAYYFRHQDAGELGRILVLDAPGGHCHLSCEIVGDPADPMTARRAEIFEPIARMVLGQMKSAGDAGAIVPPPPPGPDNGVTLENLLVQCPRCSAAVARLVCALEAAERGCFEDHARMLFPTFADFDILTWIIGPDLDDSPLETRPNNIMQVWPTRGPIRRLSPALFNPELAQLQEEHCAQK